MESKIIKINKIVKIILPFVFLFVVSIASAQVDEGLEDLDGAPLQPLPIKDYVIPMLLLGITTAFVLLRKKAVHKQS
jgi:hypothetical protein